MARQKGIYARIKTDRGSVRQYQGKLERAGNRTLDLIGRRAARQARVHMTRSRSGETRGSINYYREGKVVGVTVGTMAGAVQEFGRGAGRRGGPISALGYLRRGMGDAMHDHIDLLRSELRKGV